MEESSLKDCKLFISHYTKDDSHSVYQKVDAFMSAKDITVFNPTTQLPVDSTPWLGILVIVLIIVAVICLGVCVVAVCCKFPPSGGR